MKTSEIKNYMLMTTISCFKTDDINCSQNKHFDEVFKVIRSNLMVFSVMCENLVAIKVMVA